MARLRSSSSLLAALAALLIAPVALAQTPSDKAAAAQALFDDALTLLEQGKAAEACPKLAESQRLDPGMGTQYRLAECYEQTGRFASAWALYLEVAEAARAAHMPEREKVARKNAGALAPRLSHLTLLLPPEIARIPGLTLERDGESIGAPMWGMPIPIDPGTHTLRATAPGKKPWQNTVDIEAKPSSIEIQIPLLEDIQQPIPSRVASHPSKPPATTPIQATRSNVPALLLGGLAAAAAGMGGAMLALEADKKSEATSLSTRISEAGGQCIRIDESTVGGTDPRCGDVYDAARAADRFHDIGVIALIGAGVTAGAALGYVLWPGNKHSADKKTGLVVRATPVAGLNRGGLLLSGSF